MRMDGEKVLQAVKKHEARILEAEQWIWRHPETGYHEWKANEYMAKAFEEMGYTLKYAGDIPGFTTVIDTGRPGPRVLVMAELDSLICADHPDADPVTKAVHACGHHAQCAAMVGLAAALKEEDMLEGLSGSICLCCVPAEELIEIERRQEMRKQGKIHYMGGKVEFLYRGYFDECDIAMMVHTTVSDKAFGMHKGSNGCMVKKIEYIGKASHAGGSPEKGVNALYAANLGMQAVNALRETFVDNEHIRFHPIVTTGGDAVNAIPADVVMESYVRGATMEAILRENGRVNRALAGAAAAMGAKLRLSDSPGYAPLINDDNLRRIAVEAMRGLVGDDMIDANDGWGYGSTDMGDISSVMPAVHPYAAGASGTGHGNDYRITDPYKACVQSAALQMNMLRLLLEDDAKEARRVVKEGKPVYASKEEYFRAMDSVWLDKEVVQYEEDGSITIRTK
jgi:amidohydrolase